MPDLVQFVDRIDASPTVRLDLNDDVTWSLAYQGTDLSPPPLKFAQADTLLTNGERRTASAYANRRLVLALDLKTATVDGQGTQLQKLWRELDRPTNFVRWQVAGMSRPVFFRTLRSSSNRVMDVPGLGDFRQVTVEVDAEPFAYGLKQTSTATVYADPAEGVTLNANPFFEGLGVLVEGGFEVDMTGWVGVNGTAVRSTAQAHAGVASALVTPSGSGVVARVEADTSLAVPALPGQTFTADGWVRPTTANKPAAVQITWRDSGGAFLSSTVATAAATAGAWQFLTVTGVAPAGAAFAVPAAGVGSTPAVGDTAHVDELRLLTVTDWTSAGCTFVRSTAQFHEGVASGLLTPDGVTANAQVEAGNVPVTVAASYRGSAWVRCAVARNVDIGIFWFTAGNVFISTSFTTVAVAATTWTFLSTTQTAPPTAAFGRIMVRMTGTPPAGNTLHIDEARVRQAGDVGGMCFDLSGVLGDVQTPLVIAMTANSVTTGADRNVVFATRRRGTPSAASVVLQAESGLVGTDTTTPSNAVDASGSGNNFTRTTFATNTAMAVRVQWSPFPTVASVDARGEYRVLLRCRQTVAGDAIKVRLGWGGVAVDTANAVQSASWFWIDLGRIAVPRGADPVYDGFSGVELPAFGTTLDVSAQRVSGSGGLDMDVLLLAPADDQFSTVFMPSATSGFSVFDGIARQAYRLDASGAVAPTPNDVYSIPGGGSVIHASPGVTNRVWVVQGLAGADAGMTAATIDTATPLTVSYWPHYLSVAAP